MQPCEKRNLQKPLERVHANGELTAREDVSCTQKRLSEDDCASKLKQQSLDFCGSAVKMLELREKRRWSKTSYKKMRSC